MAFDYVVDLIWEDTLLRNHCDLGIHAGCTGKHWIWISEVGSRLWSLVEAWPCQCECHSVDV